MPRPSARLSQHGPRRGRAWLALAVAALLTAAGLRALPLLDNRFHPDEALYASFARRIASGQDPLLAGVLVDKPPLPFYLSALSMALVGPTELGARLPSFYAGLVSVALAAALGRRLYGARVGLVAAGLLAVSPFAILFDITAFIDPLLTAAGLWALWAAAGGKWRTAALALAVAFAIKQTALIYAPLVLALALWRLPARATARTLGRTIARAAGPVLVGLALAAGLVFAWDAARQPAIGFWTQGYADNVPGRWVRANEVLPRAQAWLDLLHYLTASAVLNVMVVAGLPLLLLAEARSGNRGALADRILAGYLVLYLAAYWLLAFNVWDRYLLPVLPLALLLLARVIDAAASGLVRLVRRWRPGWPARVGVTMSMAAGLVLVTAAPAWAATQSRYPVGGDHGAYDGLEGAAAYINALPAGTVLYDHWLSWEWGFYLYGGPVYVAWLPTPAALATDLRAFGNTSPRYLAVPAWEPEAEWRAAAAEAGFDFALVYTAYRRDGVVTIRVYRLEAGAMSARWQRLAKLGPPLAVVALVIMFVGRLALTQGILARGDTFLYFYPYWAYRAQALLAGRLPLWEPLLFMGAPFLANSQAGVLYPLNWPLAIFSAPVAVKIALVSHLAIMALGTYTFARRAARQSKLAAVLAATLFALGGYVTAQMEHVNQLQGLAWLPWLMLLAHGLMQLEWRAAGVKRRAAGLAAGVAAVVALQLLAGHTQTAFISVAAAAMYAAVLAVGPLWAHWRGRGANRPTTSAYGALACMGLLLAAVAAAAVLAAAQVLPTLELSGQSLRGGGLPLREALSFSLDPRLLGRALLPGYSRELFSEFVGYLGVTGLALAVLGVARTWERVALIAVAGVGLAFALGAYDPLYLGLASLPPFNLFRVPARWLVLLAWGGALLAGHGLDALAGRPTLKRLAAACALPLALMAFTPLAAALVPAGETGPLGQPAAVDWLGWLLPLALLAGVAWLPARLTWRRSAVAALAAVELLVAAQGLPYNQLTTPEAYSSVRPAMTQLLADQSTDVSDRFLSISALRFEPGDQAELQSAFAGQLSDAAFYDFIIATKHKEVLSPNLPLAWGVPAVDGYDGGVLPLRHYADFTTLFTGAASADGRLRENVTSAPDPRLLALVNGRYLITDKVNDAWVEGVFYDLEFTLTLAAGERSQIAYLPQFTATAVGVVADAYGGTVTLDTSGGQRLTLPVTGSRVTLPAPTAALTLTLEGPLTVRGLALIDERSGAFQTLTLGPYRLVHSGDVKVYEHQAVLPRAFVVGHAETADDAAALARLADPAFDVSRTVLLADAGVGDEPATDTAARSATITQYAPEGVTVQAEGPGYLLLTDAYYPGWVATVDGQPAPIWRADVMFRAVALPAGAHEVVFTYAPRSVTVGLWVSGAAWLMLVAVLVYALRGRLQAAHV